MIDGDMLGALGEGLGGHQTVMQDEGGNKQERDGNLQP